MLQAASPSTAHSDFDQFETNAGAGFNPGAIALRDPLFQEAKKARLRMKLSQDGNDERQDRA